MEQWLATAGVRVVRTPPRAPNCNAYAERFVRSVKEECLNRIVPLGEWHLRRTLQEFVTHYHRERNHQGLANELIDGPACRTTERCRSSSPASRRNSQLLLPVSRVDRRRDPRWDRTGRSDHSDAVPGPNCNAYAERFVRSIKEECLARVIPLGERHLRRTIAEFVTHYHAERNHQGIGNELIQPLGRADGQGRVCRRQRIGGVLNYYYRAA